MPLGLRLQLSAMMFLEYFVWGSWYVTMGTYLGQVHQFTGPEIGLMYGTPAIGAMISPFFVGLFADRFFATERILAVLHILGAALLYWAGQIDTFSVLYPVMIVYAVLYMPTIALTNSLSFHHVTDPGRDFPGLRVLGTIGWIAAGLVLGFFLVEASNQPFMLAAASSLALGIYSFFLPHTPPKGRESTTGLRFETLSLLKRPSFAVFVLASFFICIPLSFYYGWTNPFLNDVQAPKPAALMTLGQGSEIFFMLLMPFFFRILGVKRLLLIGMGAWVLRYFLFSEFHLSGIGFAFIVIGILLHGICFDFYFVTSQIYIDRKVPVTARASAQGFLAFVTYGVGMFVGTWLSGEVVGRHTDVARSVSFSSTGALVASPFREENLRLFDAAKGSETKILEGEDLELTCAAFSPAAPEVSAGTRAQSILQWRGIDGEPERRRIDKGGKESPITALAYAPAGDAFAAGRADGSVEIHGRTGDARTFDAGGPVTALAYDPEGARLAAATAGGAVRLLDAAELREIRSLEAGLKGAARAVTFLSAGSRLVAAYEEGMAAVWDIESEDDPKTIALSLPPAAPPQKDGEPPPDLPLDVWSLAPAPQETGFFAAGSPGRAVALYDAETGSRRRVYAAEGGATIRALAVSPDGSRLAARTDTPSILVWRTETEAPPVVCQGPRSSAGWYDWAEIWHFPGVFALIVLVLFALTFHDPAARPGAGGPEVESEPAPETPEEKSPET